MAHPASIVVALVLGAPPEPPGPPPDGPMKPVAAALDVGRWADAEDLLGDAWAEQHAWLDAWTKTYDAVRLPACAALRTARDEVEHAEVDDQNAQGQWAVLVDTLDGPPERLGFRPIKRPRLILGLYDDPECMASRATARTALIERLDRRGEREIMVRLEAAFSGAAKGQAPAPACAFGVRWATEVHQAFNAFAGYPGGRPPNVHLDGPARETGQMAAKAYVWVLDRCVDAAADRELVVQAADLSMSMRDDEGSMMWFDRLAKGWPDHEDAFELGVRAFKHCDRVVASGRDSSAMRAKCEDLRTDAIRRLDDRGPCPIEGTGSAAWAALEACQAELWQKELDGQRP